MRNPFALQVYERFLSGESIKQLSAELEIPADRIEKRLRAAAVYLQNPPHPRLIALAPARGPEHCGQADQERRPVSTRTSAPRSA